MPRSKKGTYALVLTGQPEGQRLRVLIHGEPVLLPPARFAALCRLVYQQHKSVQGFVSVNRGTIYHLRKDLRHALPQPRLADVVESGLGEYYRLTVPPSQIAVHKTFAELVPLRQLDQQIIDELRRLLPEVE